MSIRQILKGLIAVGEVMMNWPEPITFYQDFPYAC